jgi:hypothetical protein
MNEFKRTIDGQEYNFSLNMPKQADHRKASIVRHKAFVEYLVEGLPLQAKAKELFKKNGAWTQADEDKEKTLGAKISQCIKQLDEGGIKLSEAKKLAFQIHELRQDGRELLSERAQLLNETVEGQADNDEFYCLVSRCLVYYIVEGETPKRFFESYDALINSEENVVVRIASNILSNMIYSVGSDSIKELPENRFLLEYGFINEDMKFVNDAGDLVDVDDRLVDKDGRWINSDGEFVDKDGVRVTEDGEYVVDKKPFLTESGEEIKPQKPEVDVEEKSVVEESVVETVKKKRRGRPKKS